MVTNNFVALGTEPIRYQLVQKIILTDVIRLTVWTWYDCYQCFMDCLR